MSTTTLSAATLPDTAPAAARAVFRLLKNLKHGTLDIQLPDGSGLHVGQASDGGLRASMRLVNWNVCGAAMRSGDIGFAESFIAGDWTSPDPAALLKLLIANRSDVESLVYGTWWGALLYRARHWLHRNSRSGSKKNIHAHYDLGNEFYRLWLDPTMNYSSAWFEGDLTRTMEEAQSAKVRRALTECGVKPGDRVLEIGCGWGALAECAAREFGATVTGVTLSSEQLEWAQKRLADAGLPGDLRFQDYRDLNTGDRGNSDGPFDAIASIEMFEAVGREYWPSFFETVSAQLKPGGKACVQSIVIRDDLFERYVHSTDFIQQYIFPGGLLPSPTEFRKAAARAGLRVVDELAFGLDYAETLLRWRQRFLSQEGPVRQLGFDSRFMRIWEFYLAYCEAAFTMGNTDVMQFTLQRD
ncbi:MAG: cyclopropane-fatty-acyl-phospholipid synthase family protein [Burkholderiaceae bacterium]|nr:cyclopropane-fatty-acyl-phospholipid synthase family protein [Burkholderiaceae bacterium]